MPPCLRFPAFLIVPAAMPVAFRTSLLAVDAADVHCRANARMLQDFVTAARRKADAAAAALSGGGAVSGSKKAGRKGAGGAQGRLASPAKRPASAPQAAAEGAVQGDTGVGGTGMGSTSAGGHARQVSHKQGDGVGGSSATADGGVPASAGKASSGSRPGTAAKGKGTQKKEGSGAVSAEALAALLGQSSGRYIDANTKAAQAMERRVALAAAKLGATQASYVGLSPLRAKTARPVSAIAAATSARPPSAPPSSSSQRLVLEGSAVGVRTAEGQEGDEDMAALLGYAGHSLMPAARAITAGNPNPGACPTQPGEQPAAPPGGITTAWESVLDSPAFLSRPPSAARPPSPVLYSVPRLQPLIGQAGSRSFKARGQQSFRRVGSRQEVGLGTGGGSTDVGPSSTGTADSGVGGGAAGGSEAGARETQAAAAAAPAKPTAFSAYAALLSSSTHGSAASRNAASSRPPSAAARLNQSAPWPTWPQDESSPAPAAASVPPVSPQPASHSPTTGATSLSKHQPQPIISESSAHTTLTPPPPSPRPRPATAGPSSAPSSHNHTSPLPLVPSDAQVLATFLPRPSSAAVASRALSDMRRGSTGCALLGAGGGVARPGSAVPGGAHPPPRTLAQRSLGGCRGASVGCSKCACRPPAASCVYGTEWC